VTCSAQLTTRLASEEYHLICDVRGLGRSACVPSHISPECADSMALNPDCDTVVFVIPCATAKSVFVVGFVMVTCCHGYQGVEIASGIEIIVLTQKSLASRSLLCLE